MGLMRFTSLTATEGSIEHELILKYPTIGAAKRINPMVAIETLADVILF